MSPGAAHWWHAHLWWVWSGGTMLVVRFVNWLRGL